MPNLFPLDTTVDAMVQDNAQLPEVQQKTPSRSWKFDFAKGDFVRDPTGKVIEVDSYETWVQWCQKAIMTTRYSRIAYSHNYGTEYEDLIGKAYTHDAIESEIKRMTIEALMVNSYTKSVDSFSFTWDGDSVYFSCIVTSILNDTAQINNNIEGVR